MLKMDHIRTAFSFTRFPASQLLAADGNASIDPARQGGKIYRENLADMGADLLRQAGHDVATVPPRKEHSSPSPSGRGSG